MGRGKGWGSVTGTKPPYTIRYTVKGKKFSGGRTWPTKGAARAELGTIYTSVMNGTWRSPAEIEAENKAAAERESARATSIRAWTEEWLTWKSAPHTNRTGHKTNGLADSTVITYRSRIEANVLEWVTPDGRTFGDLSLSEVTGEHLSALVSSLEAKASRFSDKGNGVAALAAGTLRQLMEDAVYRGKLDDVPRVPVPLSTPVREKDLQGDYVAEESEVDALRAAMPDRWKIGIDLAVFCQLRLGELLGLQRKHIVWSDDGATATLLVRTQISTKTGLRTDLKTKASKGDLAIPKRMLEPLRQHMEGYVAGDPEAPILSSATGTAKALPSSVWDRHFRKAARAVFGKRQFWTHLLRHTGLTWYGRIPGVTFAEMRARVRHADPKVTQRYLHSSADRDRVLADQM